MTARNIYYAGPLSDHFDGTRFFNAGPNTDKGLRDVLKWRFGGGHQPWPKHQTSRPRDVPPDRSEALRVVLVGHASILIQVSGINLLLDPVWSERVSPVSFAGPKRINPPGIAFEDLPSIDAVLLSHNHYDHMDVATLARLWTAHRPRIITPLGNDPIVRRAVPGIEIAVGDWGDAFRLSGDVEVVLHPANHWSARGMRDRRMALWCGFVLRTSQGVVYCSGDTGYGDGAIFRDVPKRFGAPRLAILPIGAYEPKWFMHPQHVSPAEAVQIAADTSAEWAVGCHWGTFRLSNEGPEQPAIDLDEALDAAGISRDRFRPMHPGEVFEFPPVAEQWSEQATGVLPATPGRI